MNVNELEIKLDKLSACMEETPLLKERGFQVLYKAVEEIDLLRAKIQQPLKIAIMGEVKAGKSTLINAFAGGVVAPTNVTETTACVMHITYAPVSKAVIYFNNGETQEGSIDKIYSILKDNENDQEFFKQCAYIEVALPLKGLRNLQLLDTPGLATITQANQDKTKDYFQKVDVVLWVFNAHYLGQADVNEELRTVAKMGKPIIGIINRIDEIDEDPQRLIDYLDYNLGIYLNEIFALSAYEAFEGIKNNDYPRTSASGFGELCEFLSENIEKNSDQVQIDSIASSADALERKIGLFHQQILEQIELKLANYNEIDVQLHKNSIKLKNRQNDFVEDWINTSYLQTVLDDYYEKIDNTGLFTTISGEELRQQVIAEVNRATTVEFDSFMESFQQRVSQEWKTSLEVIDNSLSEIYEQVVRRQGRERASALTVIPGADASSEISSAILTAGAVGGGLAFYTAVLGPAAAYITMGAALGSIMPPVLLAGACLGGVQALLKNKQLKARNKGIVYQIIHEARMNMNNYFMPRVTMLIDELCNRTCERARDEFAKANFDGRSFKELEELRNKLQAFVSLHGVNNMYLPANPK